MKKFENEENIFYISTLCKRDVFGRICLKKRGFIAMKGYNEALVGYGFEDAEFYDGLESCRDMKSGETCSFLAKEKIV